MSHIPPISLNAQSTIPAYRIVKGGSAAMSAALDDTVTAFPLGISTDTVLETGAAIPIAGPGSIAKLYFNDTVSVMGLVASNANGQGKPHVDATAGSYVVGIALEPVSATGTIAKIFVQPFFKSIP